MAVPVVSDHALHFDPACEECVYLARPTVIRVPAQGPEQVQRMVRALRVVDAKEGGRWPDHIVAAYLTFDDYEGDWDALAKAIIDEYAVTAPPSDGPAPLPRQ